MSLCLNHHTMKICVGVEVKLNAFFNVVVFHVAVSESFN
jgi:hypothetical protein